MTVLVTGSAGHLGEALLRTLKTAGRKAHGLDIKPSPYTDHVGSIHNRGFVRECMRGVTVVVHSATLHKPHVATHTNQDFVDTNITGTLNLLEEAVAAGAQSFIYTSTTSAFGAALVPPPGVPAAWVTEEVVPVPKNIYGATKVAAEGLCELFHRMHRLPVLVLRTSRFFPEEDDNAGARSEYTLDNLQANELLYRRVDIEDAAAAHIRAFEESRRIGFGRYIISATTPFSREDLPELRRNLPAVVRRKFPDCESLFAARGWTLPSHIDRVYVNARALTELGWRPRYDFAHVLASLRAGQDFRSPLAREVGSKGYHEVTFDHGPYPVRESSAGR